MNKKEKIAFLLGMLSGDGCLPIKHNGQGYRDYAIQFYNTNKEVVKLFENLFLEIFREEGRVFEVIRANKKPLYNFCKYSKKIVEELKNLGFPEGVKRDILRIPEFIKDGSLSEKRSFFLGVLITDGCLRKNRTILFHSGSKLFLEDLSLIIRSFTNNLKPIKEYTQREIYKSYQLNLNKEETSILLNDLPSWDNGTPIALRYLYK